METQNCIPKDHIWNSLELLKTGEVSKAGVKAPPETPDVGEVAKDPKKESAYAGEVLLVQTQVWITW